MTFSKFLGMARCVQGTPLLQLWPLTFRQHCINTVIVSMRLCGCWKPPDWIFCFQMFSLSLVFITHSFFCFFTIHFFLYSHPAKKNQKLLDILFSTLCFCFSSSQCGPVREDSRGEKNALAFSFANNTTFFCFLIATMLLEMFSQSRWRVTSHGWSVMFVHSEIYSSQSNKEIGHFLSVSVPFIIWPENWTSSNSWSSWWISYRQWLLMDAAAQSFFDYSS